MLEESSGKAWDLSEDFPCPSGFPETANAATLFCLQVDECARPSFVEVAEAIERVIEEMDLGGACGTGTVSEATTPRDVLDGPGGIAAQSMSDLAPGGRGKSGAATPSTMATPSVPWAWQGEELSWLKQECNGPAGEYAGTAAGGNGAFADALQEFLQSRRAVDLLGGRDALEALKEFLFTPQPATSPGGFMEDRRSLSSNRSERAMSACASLRRSYGGPPTPVSDVVVALNSAGVPADYAFQPQAPCRVWTLSSLLAPEMLRRQEFVDEADAWEAFEANAETPCMLRGPTGNDLASRSWVVVGREPSRTSMLSSSSSLWLPPCAQAARASRVSLC